MTIALWCVAIAAIFPVICAGIAKAGFRDYDNRNPRDWLSKQQGWRARANSAQQNSWEAFAVFAAGVFAAHLAHGPSARVDLLAEIFIGLRVLYVGLYLANYAMLRSLAWSAGFAVSLGMFFT